MINDRGGQGKGGGRPVSQPTQLFTPQHGL